MTATSPGKSTLSAVIMGKPGYEVHAGEVLLDGVDLLALPAWQRAQAGMHLVMQYPTEVPGVGLNDMLTEAFKARGRVFVPVSGMEDPLTHDPSYACCTHRGSVAALDAAR